MARYRLCDIGVFDTETNIFIPESPTYLWREYQEWLAEGNIPDAQYTQEEIDSQTLQSQIDAINQAFEDAISQPVVCNVNGNTYYMDGHVESATKMKHGIEYAELMGNTVMNVVDYYNKIHLDVPIADCYEIMEQQAASYISYWTTRSIDRSNLL